MSRIIVCMLFILACWRFGNWRRWKDYYPTILFFLVCNLLGAYIMGHKSLWVYHGLINHSFSDLLISFTVFPSTAILYLTYYPESTETTKKMRVQIKYIFFWILLYTIIEVIMSELGYISYNNGWNIGWSVLINITIFVVLRVHTLRPLTAWSLVFVETLIFMYIFDVSISSLK